MKRKALSTKNLPRTLRLWWFAIVWLLMDRIDPPAWVWGVVGTLVVFNAIFTVADYFNAEDVEL